VCIFFPRFNEAKFVHVYIEHLIKQLLTSEPLNMM
jgi:hypothetical protein